MIEVQVTNAATGTQPIGSFGRRMAALMVGAKPPSAKPIWVPIAMALRKNGMRQPHDSSCSSGSAEIGRKTSVARIRPAWVPLSVKLVKKARRCGGACSSVIELAPACSPAAEMPCNMRSTTSMMGDRMPAWL